MQSSLLRSSSVLKKPFVDLIAQEDKDRWQAHMDNEAELIHNDEVIDTQAQSLHLHFQQKRTARPCWYKPPLLGKFFETLWNRLSTSGSTCWRWALTVHPIFERNRQALRRIPIVWFVRRMQRRSGPAPTHPSEVQCILPWDCLANGSNRTEKFLESYGWQLPKCYCPTGTSARHLPGRAAPSSGKAFLFRPGRPRGRLRSSCKNSDGHKCECSPFDFRSGTL